MRIFTHILFEFEIIDQSISSNKRYLVANVDQIDVEMWDYYHTFIQLRWIFIYLYSILMINQVITCL